MIVIDKSFNQNSFLTFVNTNVNRKKNFRNANVSALLGSITNKKKTHTYDASIKGSFINHNSNHENGFSTFLKVQKINGNLKYNMSNYIESDKYDINDMGFLYQNNEFNSSTNISYGIFSSDHPIAQKLGIKKGDISFGLEQKMLYKPFIYNEFILKASSYILNNNHFFSSLRLRYFFEEHDYFEARKEGQVFIKPPAIKATFITSSNFNNPISLNTSWSIQFRLNDDYQVWNEYNNHKLYYRLNPRFRINNHMFFEYILAIENEKNQFGWISNNDIEEPIFSRRNRRTITNKLTINYTFNPKTYIKLITRHYWSTIDNLSFYELNNDGGLQGINNNDNKNINFNTWNMDLNFSWEYRPGSLLSIVWQNQLTQETDIFNDLFFENINDFFKEATTNIFSIKFTYYLDYLDINKK